MPINEEIEADSVRLISATGEQLAICPLAEAMKRAEEQGLDLVQMTTDAIPVVCKLMDYGKHQFESKKSRGQSKKRQKRVDVKEVKFRMGTDKADYGVKLKNLKRFLGAGHRAKVSIRFRGREMAHKDLAVKLLERIEADLAEEGKVEQAPQIDGRQMLMVLVSTAKAPGDKAAKPEPEAEEGAAAAAEGQAAPAPPPASKNQASGSANASAARLASGGEPKPIAGKGPAPGGAKAESDAARPAAPKAGAKPADGSSSGAEAKAGSAKPASTKKPAAGASAARAKGATKPTPAAAKSAKS